MNYPNLPNSNLEITNQPEVKEITNDLLKQLQSALKSNTLFTEQVELSLKGIVRILEALLSLDFFKNADEIGSSLRNSIEWISNAGESLKIKMKEYESFFSDFNASMHANEQEVTNTLNANTENIRSELKRREKQAKNKGLNEQQAKEYALNIAKTIPEAIDKGVKVDNNGRIAIEYNGMRVGLNDKWDNQKLENKWVISSYEIYNSEGEPPSLLMAQLQGVGLGTPKLTEPNPTTKKLNKE